MFVFQSRFSPGDIVYFVFERDTRFPIVKARVEAIEIRPATEAIGKAKSYAKNWRVMLWLSVMSPKSFGSTDWVLQEKVFNSEAEAEEAADRLRQEAKPKLVASLRSRQLDLRKSLAYVEKQLSELGEGVN